MTEITGDWIMMSVFGFSGLALIWFALRQIGGPVRSSPKRHEIDPKIIVYGASEDDPPPAASIANATKLFTAEHNRQPNVNNPQDMESILRIAHALPAPPPPKSKKQGVTPIIINSGE